MLRRFLIKLLELTEDLPIEAINDVILVVGTVIASVNSGALFLQAEDLTDYNETITDLNHDLAACAHMYENWQYEPGANKFKEALAKMQIYLSEARALLKASFGNLH